MTALASSLYTTSRVLTPDAQPQQSLASRMLHSIVAAQQRKADREILHFSSIRHDWYRAEFGLELERRLFGQ